jgi:hypothetical protein
MATLEFTAKCPKCGKSWGHGYDQAELAGRLANHEPIETYCSGCDEGSVANLRSARPLSTDPARQRTRL